MAPAGSDGLDFETVMRENGSLIYTLAVRLTGNEAEGQDLAQETFVKAYENFKRFRGDSTAATWLYRICVNIWKNRVRYEKRRWFRRHVSLDAPLADETAPREWASSDAPASSSLETTDRVALVQKALNLLEPEERAIVILRDIEDKSYEEISAWLEIPMGTVKSRLARSRERLRTQLEPFLRELE